MRYSYFFSLPFFIISCNSVAQQTKQSISIDAVNTKILEHRIEGEKIIHVFVALCDNKYQGIVPVPKAIGNGQYPANNLY